MSRWSSLLLDQLSGLLDAQDVPIGRYQMAVKLPYLSTPGTLDNALPKMKVAATPPTFNNDFVAAKLQIKGGGGRVLPPFFKKLGLVAESGSPTALYQKFRNSATAGAAIAQAMRIGYKPLYEANEYCHALSDKDLKGLILEVTGLEEKNRVAELVQSTFTRLKKHADFEADLDAATDDTPNSSRGDQGSDVGSSSKLGALRIGYTINLNLPATTNIEVFDAIFRSLRRNLLRDD